MVLARWLNQTLIGMAIAASSGLLLGMVPPALAGLPRMAIAPEPPPLQNPDLFLPVPNLVADMRLVISLGDRRVYVYDQDQVKTSFPVAIGRGGWETPTGEFQVMQMIRDPRWEHPFTGVIVPAGGTNPLGSRWIGFWSDGTNTIGFHGTPNESSVGQAVSHGCVRMYNRDVQTLFEMVAVGTPVTVRP